MKKILTLCMAVLVSATMMAANYVYSLGLVGGLGLGAQFKYMIMPNFTMIEEFGYFTCPNGNKGIGYAGAIDNLVLAWQNKAVEGQGILLDYYVGGQLKVGYVGDNGIDAGLIGFGAAAGIEACMKNAPIAFSFDFRPGYGCILSSGGFGAALGQMPGMGTAFGGGGGVMASHIFDWTFNLGVRYKF